MNKVLRNRLLATCNEARASPREMLEALVDVAALVIVQACPDAAPDAAQCLIATVEANKASVN